MRGTRLRRPPRGPPRPPRHRLAPRRRKPRRRKAPIPEHLGGPRQQRRRSPIPAPAAVCCCKNRGAGDDAIAGLLLMEGGADMHILHKGLMLGGLPLILV